MREAGVWYRFWLSRHVQEPSERTHTPSALYAIVQLAQCRPTKSKRLLTASSSRAFHISSPISPIVALSPRACVCVCALRSHVRLPPPMTSPCPHFSLFSFHDIQKSRDECAQTQIRASSTHSRTAFVGRHQVWLRSHHISKCYLHAIRATRVRTMNAIAFIRSQPECG